MSKFGNMLVKNMVILFVSFSVIHTIMAMQTVSLTILPDEFGPIAVAAHFSGYDWSNSVPSYAYYGYGQSIFYIPLFKLIDDGILLYRMMLVINGLFMSFIPVIAYYISMRFFEMKPSISVFLSVIVGLYPTYIIYTKKTWNESLIYLLLWAILLVVLCSIPKPTIKKSILLAFLMIYGYATHGRFLAIIAAVIILGIVYYLVYKKLFISVKPFMITLIVCIISDYFIKDYIIQNVYQNTTEAVMVNTLSNALITLPNTFEIRAIVDILRLLLSNILSISLITFGLLGLVISIFINKRSKIVQSPHVFIVGIFGFSTTVSSVGLFAIAAIPDILAKNRYLVIYGRYYDYVGGIIVFFACYLIYKFKFRAIPATITYGIILAMVVLVNIIEHNKLNEYGIFALQSPTLISFSSENLIRTGSDFIFTSSILLLITGILFVFLVNRQKIISYILICCLFIYSSVTMSGRFIISSTNIFPKIASVYEFSQTIRKKDDILSSSFTIYADSGISRYQLLLKEYAILPIPVDNMVTDNSIILSGSDQQDIETLVDLDPTKLYELFFQGENTQESAHVYIYGEQLAKQYTSCGYILQKVNNL